LRNTTRPPAASRIEDTAAKPHRTQLLGDFVKNHTTAAALLLLSLGAASAHAATPAQCDLAVADARDEYALCSKAGCDVKTAANFAVDVSVVTMCALNDKNANAGEFLMSMANIAERTHKAQVPK
jgi:hypothetical protein